MKCTARRKNRMRVYSTVRQRSLAQLLPSLAISQPLRLPVPPAVLPPTQRIPLRRPILTPTPLPIHRLPPTLRTRRRHATPRCRTMRPATRSPARAATNRRHRYRPIRRHRRRRAAVLNTRVPAIATAIRVGKCVDVLC